jgi:ABC-type microcin C transport system permease subunit YejB
MKNKEKDFDAVKMMREIREKLRKKYEGNPGLREKRLKEIHAKYGLKPIKRRYSATSSLRENLNP